MATCSSSAMCPSVEVPYQDSPVPHRTPGAEAGAAPPESPAALEEGTGESDGSLGSSELSSSSSSARDSAYSEEAESDEDSEEVSSSGLGASQPGASTQPLSAADRVNQAAQSDCQTLAMLPSEWLAQHAIPTTHDLAEALRSNGRLAYVPASTAPAFDERALPTPAEPQPRPAPIKVAEQGPIRSPTSPTSVLSLSPGGGAGAFGSPIAWAGNPFEAVAAQQPDSPIEAAHATGAGTYPLLQGCGAWAGADAAAAAVARRQQQLVCSMLDCLGHGKSPRARQLESAARRSAAVYGTSVPSSLAIAAALASGQLSFPARLEPRSARHTAGSIAATPVSFWPALHMAKGSGPPALLPVAPLRLPVLPLGPCAGRPLHAADI